MKYWFAVLLVALPGFISSVLAGDMATDVTTNTTANVSSHPPAWSTMDYADFGKTRVASGGRNDLVIFLADAQSRPQAEAAAAQVATEGGTAALVDLDSYFARMTKQHAACIDTVTLLDVYAQFVQQSLQFEHFSRPVLIGFGSAAAYVKLLLAQAPAGILAGGISVHSDTALLLPSAPCLGVDGVRWQSPTVPVILPVVLHQESPWIEVSAGSGQWLSVLHGWLQKPVLAKSDAAKPVASSALDIKPVDDLPLIELPQTGGGKAPYFVIVISGDGGWANIDKDIAGELGQRGVAVVGWNSLRYFWEEKTPEKMSDDLARVIAYYQHAWGKSGVVLVGFSLGADVLPFMVSRLPESARSSVHGLGLLSPSQNVDFQFHISNWLGTDSASSHDLLPEMTKISEIPLVCVYGAEDDDPTLCQQLKTGPGVQITRLPGDHHFAGDYRVVTQLLLARFPVLP